MTKRGAVSGHERAGCYCYLPAFTRGRVGWRGLGWGGGVGQDRLLPAQRFSFRLACGGSRSLYYDFRFFPMGGCLFNGVLFYGGIQRSLLYDGVPAPRPRGVPAGNAPPRKGSQEPGSPSRGVEGEASPGSSLWLRWPAKLLPSPCGSGGGLY